MQAQVAGPYWINTYPTGEHVVCGRHGRIIERFTDEAQADALCRQLQGRLPPAPAKAAPRPNKLQLSVMQTVARRGVLVVPSLSDTVRVCEARGWMKHADRADGFAIELTDAGMTIAAAA